MPRPARPATPTLNTGHSLYSAIKAIWYFNGGVCVDALGTGNLTAQGTAGTASGSYGEVGRLNANDEAYRATASAAQKVTTAGSLLWYGVPLATSNTYGPVFSLPYNQAGDSPYSAFGLERSASGDNIALRVADGVAAYFVPSAGLGGWDWSALYNTDVTVVGNHSNGAQALYVNGTSRGTDTLPINIGYGASSYIGFGPLAAAYAGYNAQTDNILGILLNRVATGAEIAAFDADPWEVLRADVAPTLVGTTINAAAIQVAFEWSTAVNRASFDATFGGTLHSGLALGSYISGEGTTTLTYALSPTGKVFKSDFDTGVTVSIASGKVTAVSGGLGNDTITNASVTNNSTVIYRPAGTATYKVEADGLYSNTDDGTIGGRSGVGRGRHRGRRRGRWM